MKKIENVSDQIDIGIQNLYMHTVIDEKLRYDGNVMHDIRLKVRMIKRGLIHRGIVLQIVVALLAM